MRYSGVCLIHPKEIAVPEQQQTYPRDEFDRLINTVVVNTTWSREKAEEHLRAQGARCEDDAKMQDTSQKTQVLPVFDFTNPPPDEA